MCLYRRVSAYWLICLEDLKSLSVVDDRANLNCFFVFVVTEPDLKKKKIPCLTQIGHLSDCQRLVVKWSGYDSCVEYLARFYLIKLVEKVVIGIQ